MFVVTYRDGILVEIGADGTTTPRGSTGALKISGIDVDTKGLGYAVQYSAVPSALFRVDLTARSITPFTALHLADGSPVGGCTALDLSPAGALTANCDIPVLGIGIVDPATGLFTPRVPDVRSQGLETDPTTGILYASVFSVSTVDLAAGTQTTVGRFTGPPADLYDIGVFDGDFDSAGTLWSVGQILAKPGANLFAFDTGTWSTPITTPLDEVGGFRNDGPLSVTVWSGERPPPLVRCSLADVRGCAALIRAHCGLPSAASTPGELARYSRCARDAITGRIG
jgi:hypothetical protein